MNRSTVVRNVRCPSGLLFSLGPGMQKISRIGTVLDRVQLVRDGREKQSFAVASFVTRATVTNTESRITIAFYSID